MKTAATPRIMSPGHRDADREGTRRRGPRRRLLRRAAAGRPHRLHPRRLVRTSTPSGLLVNVDGYQIQPGITIPENANWPIHQHGRHRAGLSSGLTTTPTELGQTQLYRFVNKEGLEPAGDNYFVETAASGAAQGGVPNTDGMGPVLQGYLESANVNPVTEIADLTAAQRASNT